MINKGEEKMEIFWLWIVLIIIVIISLIIVEIFTFLTVPIIAQKKGFNIYAWIFIAWFFGIISYFLIKRLNNNNVSSVNEIAKIDNESTKSSIGKSVIINDNKTAKTSVTQSVVKASYSAWICPKCGEKNNYAAKNCINCFEPRP